MISVFKKEFRSYMNNVTGAVFIAFLLFFAGIYVTAVNLRGGYTSFEYVLSNCTIVFLLLAPLLGMRSFAEEKRSKTDQLLYSLPMSVTKIVLGKYFAMLAVFAIPVFVMGLYPLILSLFGEVFFKGAYIALLGFFVLGAALIAICMFMSTLTESQVISAVISFGALLVMYMMNGLSTTVPTSPIASYICFFVLSIALGVVFWLLTRDYVISAIAAVVCLIPLNIFYFANNAAFGGLFGKVISYLAVFDRFTDMTGGIFDVTALVYLLSFAVFFVYLTVQAVEKRRWS